MRELLLTRTHLPSLRVASTLRIFLPLLGWLMVSLGASAQHVIMVHNLNDDGPGSFRQGIRDAAPGDFVRLNVTGTISPDSTIFIKKGITIQGPMPIHLKLEGSNLGFGEPLLELDPASGVLTIEGLTISQPQVLITGAASAVETYGGQITFQQCLFENCIAEVGGAIFVVGGTVKTERCSFINNEANVGGAVNNDDIFESVNCAYHLNDAVFEGSAIYSGGTTTLVHNTIYKNGTNTSGKAVYAESGSMSLRNNLIALNYGANSETNLGNMSATWSTQQGNLIRSNQSAISFFPTQPNDLVMAGATLGLRSTIITDGYGIKYYPIVSNTSDAIDRGGSLFLPAVDLRNGPRFMDSGLGIGNFADAGCVEYTPWIVTDLSGTSAGNGPPTGSFGWAVAGVNQGDNNGMIVFDLPGPSYTIPAADQYDLYYTVNIDGYTQPNTAVPGPADPIQNLPATPANPVVTFDGTNAGSDGIVLRNAANSQISGFNMIYYTGAAILMRDGTSGNHIWGNHVGTNQQGNQILPNLAGVVAISSSLNMIGGHRTWQRNVLCNNDTAGVALSGQGSILNVVAGNFIGTNPAGLAEMPNGYGVFIADTAVLNLIGDSLDARNIISGNDWPGIAIQDTTPDINTILNNWIGIDAAGTSALPNHIGVYIGVHANLVSVGTNIVRYPNVISGNDSAGIVIRSGVNSIQGNVIGLSPDGLSTIGNGADGIYAYNTSLSVIGGNFQEKVNFIGGNGGHGIKVEQATLMSITGNVIGAMSDFNSDAGNDGHGVLLGAGTSLIGLGDTNFGNLIVHNDSSGVAVINSAGGHTFRWNVIGVDTMLTGDLGNGQHGILIKDGGFFNNAIGDTTENGPVNVIGYNGLNGITVINDNGVMMHRNVIFQNGGLAIDLDNDGPTLNDADDLDVGANNLQNTPTFTALTSCLNGTLVEGAFQGDANATIHLEFYASLFPDGSGYGEAEVYIGSHLDSTDASGQFTFSEFLNTPLPPGAIISATASNFTNGFRSTSEMSANGVPTVVFPPSVSNDTIACVGTPLDSIWANANYGGELYWALLPNFNALLDSGSSIMPSNNFGAQYYYVIELAGECVTSYDSILVEVFNPDDASFTYPAFCANTTGQPDVVNTPGGIWDFGTVPGDNAVIDGSNGEITNATPGASYQVKYITTGACPAIFQINVTALDIPSITQVNVIDESCAGANDGSLTITGIPGNGNLVYSIDGGSSTQINNTFNGLPAGNYDIYVVDDLGCTATLPQALGGGAASTLLTPADPTLCPGDSVTLQAGGNGSFTWVALGGIDTLAGAPTVAPSATTPYLVSLNDGQCIFTDTVVVTVLTMEECGFNIFNAFSPDGDGTNEHWHIRGIEEYPNNKVVVLNRWGDAINDFEGYNNADTRWQGLNEGGDPVPSGTYFYVIDLGEDQARYSGWIRLDR